MSDHKVSHEKNGRDSEFEKLSVLEQFESACFPWRGEDLYEIGDEAIEGEIAAELDEEFRQAMERGDFDRGSPRSEGFEKTMEAVFERLELERKAKMGDPRAAAEVVRRKVVKTIAQLNDAKIWLDEFLDR